MANPDPPWEKLYRRMESFIQEDFPEVHTGAEPPAYRTVKSRNEELRQARLELEESRARYRDLFDSAPVGYFSLDRNGLILEVNQTGAGLLGAAPEDLWSKPLSLFISGKDKDLFRAHRQQVLKSGTRQICELELARRDGSRFPAQLLSSHAPDSSWATEQLRVVVTDITALRRAEALSDERRRLYALLDVLPAYVLLMGPDFRLRFGNQCFRETFGDRVGQTYREIFPDREQDFLSRVLETGVPEEWEWTAADGRSYRIYNYHLTDRDGTPLILEMGLDLTFWRRAEEARSHLLEILEATPDVVITADVNGKLIYANRAGRRLLSPDDKEDICGLHIFDIHPGWAQTLVTGEALTKAKRDGVWQGETAFLSRDGREVPASQVILAHRDERNAVKFFSTIGRDVTGIKQAEQALHQVNRALRTLSACHRAVLHASEEPEFLREICRAIVEEGGQERGYRLAWVGLAEPDRKPALRPVAQAGYEAGYLKTLGFTGAANERSRSPGALAVRTGKPVVVRDTSTDTRFKTWRTEALKRSYGSCLALPLQADGQTFGVLSIYAKEPDAFDSQEVGFLVDVADTLAFGITSRRALAEQQQGVEALKRAHAELAELLKVREAELAHVNEQRLNENTIHRFTQDSLEALLAVLQTLVLASPQAIVSFDCEGHVKLWNPMAESLFGWSESQVLGNFIPIFPAEEKENFLALLTRLQQGESVQVAEMHGRGKTGATLIFGLSAAPLHDSRGQVTGGMVFLSIPAASLK